jgi:hypothetical protein
MMTRKFEMSMIAELSFFLGLQIKQLKEGTFVCQSNYVRDIFKKLGMKDAKPIKTPMAIMDILILTREVNRLTLRFIGL